MWDGELNRSADCRSRVAGGWGGEYPAAFGIVRDEFPRDTAAIGIALISASVGVGGGLGIVLAGPIVQHFSYHWLFWFRLIAIAVSLVAAIAVVPKSSVRVPGHVNLLGAALLSGWLVSLLVAVSEAPRWHWTSGRTLGLFAVALVLAIIWVIADTRAREPLIDMRIMRRRGVWTVNAVGLMLGAGLFGAFVLIPQLVELPKATGVGFGSSITGAGIFLVPATAMVLLVSPLAGRMDKLVGSKVPLVLGALFALAGYIVLAIEHKHRADIDIATTLLGIGTGFAFASMTNLIVHAVKSDETGQATGVNTVTRFVGGAIGGGVFGSVLSSHLAHGAPKQPCLHDRVHDRRDHARRRCRRRRRGTGTNTHQARLAMYAHTLMLKRIPRGSAATLTDGGESSASAGSALNAGPYPAGPTSAPDRPGCAR